MQIAPRRALDLADRSAAAASSGPIATQRAVGRDLRPASPRSSGSIDRRWCSSTRGGWPSASRIIWPSGWARTPSPRTTAACRARSASTPSSGSRPASCARSWRRRRSSSASTSARSISSARSDRRARSPSRVQRIGRAGHWRGAVPEGPALRRPRATSWSSARRWCCAIRRGELDRIVDSRRAARHPGAADRRDVRRRRLARRRPVRARPPRVSVPRSAARGLRRRSSRCCREGIAARRGRYGAYLHRDRVNGRVRGRRGARLAAITSGGAIPDTALYTVVAEPEGTVVGTVDEDFAVESLAGDIILLGNTSWRIRRVARAACSSKTRTARRRRSRSGAAKRRRAPPSCPRHVAEVRETVSDLAPGRDARTTRAHRRPAAAAAVAWLAGHCGLDRAGAEQIVDYVVAGRAVLGAVPTQHDDHRRAVLRRGRRHAARHPRAVRRADQQGLGPGAAQAVLPLVQLRAAGGGDRQRHQHRAGRAAQLSARRRLPVPAAGHRARGARAGGARRRRSSARAGAGTRAARSRCCASAAARRSRFRSSACSPTTCWPRCSPTPRPARRTSKATSRFPITRSIREVMKDVLTEAMDLDGLDRRADAASPTARSAAWPWTRRCRPSFSHEILNANPYAYLDDAPLEERRARAVEMRRDAAGDRALGSRRARSGGDRRSLRATPGRTCATPTSCTMRCRRSSRSRSPSRRGLSRAVAAVAPGAGERSPRAVASTARRPDATGSPPSGRRRFGAVFPSARVSMRAARRRLAPAASRDDALVALVQGWLAHIGPTTHGGTGAMARARRRATSTRRCCGSRPPAPCLRGSVPSQRTAGSDEPQEWCDRRLLARIHRLTLGALRREIAPVTPAEFMRWLLRWQHVAPGTQLPGERGTLEVLRQLQGFEAPANAWEPQLLARRIADYDPADARSPVPDRRGRLGPPVAASGDARARRRSRAAPRRADERGADHLLRPRRRGLDGAAAPHGRRSQRRAV